MASAPASAVDVKVPDGKTAKVPLLTKTNYEAWNSQVLTVCYLNDLEDWLEKDVPEPAKPQAEAPEAERAEAKAAYKVWLGGRSEVLSIINETVINMKPYLAQYGYNENSLQPHILYSTIKSAFGTVSDVKALDTLITVTRLDISSFATPLQYFLKFQELMSILDNSRFKQHEMAKITFLFRQVQSIAPVSFDIDIRQSLEGKLTYEQALQIVTRIIESPDLNANKQLGPSSVQQASSTTPTASQTPPRRACTHCGY